MRSLPVPLLVVLCLTLGLAPFYPEPHLWQKLRLLAAGRLVKAIDIVDLLLHGLPFLLLFIRLFSVIKKPSL